MNVITTGLLHSAAAARTFAATGAAGGLEMMTMRFDRRIGIECIEAPAKSKAHQLPQTGHGCRFPARAERRCRHRRAGNTSAGYRFRSPDHANRTRLHGVGETEAEAVDDGGAAVGAHDQKAVFDAHTS